MGANFVVPISYPKPCKDFCSCQPSSGKAFPIPALCSTQSHNSGLESICVSPAATAAIVGASSPLFVTRGHRRAAGPVNLAVKFIAGARALSRERLPKLMNIVLWLRYSPKKHSSCLVTNSKPDVLSTPTASLSPRLILFCRKSTQPEQYS
jgi:hypothetical protein